MVQCLEKNPLKINKKTKCKIKRSVKVKEEYFILIPFYLKLNGAPEGLMVDGSRLYSLACNEEHRKHKERRVGGVGGVTTGARVS